MSTGNHDESGQSRPKASIGWALRRAALGLAGMMLFVMLAAWLLYSSIDPDEASAAGLPTSQTEQGE